MFANSFISYFCYSFLSMAGVVLLEYLNTIDVQLFLFFNVTLANPFFDVVMPFITNAYTWIPVWVAVIGGLLWALLRQAERLDLEIDR